MATTDKNFVTAGPAADRAAGSQCHAGGALLLPCPFCGSDARLTFGGGGVICDDCGVTTGNLRGAFDGRTPEEITARAVAKWNRRESVRNHNAALAVFNERYLHCDKDSMAFLASDLLEFAESLVGPAVRS